MCSAIKYQAVCQKDFTVHSPLFGRGTAALGDFFIIKQIEIRAAESKNNLLQLESLWLCMVYF